MKVVVIHPEFSGAIGGAKKVSFKIAEILAREGHNVTYIGEDVNGEDFRKIHEIETKKIDFKELEKPLSSKILDSLSTFQGPKYVLQNRHFASLVQKEDPDLAVFTADLWRTNPDFDFPTLQYVHGEPVDESSLHPLSMKILELIGSEERIFEADINAFNSDFTRDSWEGREGKSDTIIYPPVDTDFPEVDWGDRENRAVVAGRIAEGNLVLEAIDIIERTPNLDLEIVGLVDDEKYLERIKDVAESKEFVTISTNLPKSRFKQVLANSKIGLNISRGETFGITVAEYVSAGVLPMIRDSGGQTEIVNRECFKFTNSKEVPEKIQELLETPQESKAKLPNPDEFSESMFRDKVLNCLRLMKQK